MGGGVIASLIVDVAANTVKLQQDVQKITGTLDGISRIASTVGRALTAAFSVTALIAFARQIFADADALTKLSDKTGISTTWLQRFRVAGDDAGNTLGELTGAITQMQNRLVGGDKSVVAALQRLSLDLAHLRSISPEQQFIEISEALKEVKTPADQVNIAMALFGRTGASVLPTIKRGFDDVKNSAEGMSAASIQAIDAAGDAITRFGRRARSMIGEIVGQHLSELGEGGLWGYIIGGRSARDRQDVLDFLERTTAMIPTGLPMPTPFALGGETDDNLDQRLRQHEESLRRIEEANRDAATAAKEYRDLWNEIGVRQLEDEAARIAQLTELLTPAGSGGWMSGGPLEIFSSNPNGQGLGMQGLADGTVQLIEKTKTWRDTLHEVVDALHIVGDKWSNMAMGILRQSEAIVTLWQGGNKTAAIGTAIGVAGSYIPTDSTGGSVASGAASGAAVGSTFGPWGMAIGAGVGALVGWFKSQKAAKQVNDVRDAFVHAAGGLALLDQRAHAAGMTLTALLDARTPKEYQAAIDELTAALEFQDNSWNRLMEAVDKYGFQITELGPALSQQKLDEQVMELLTDFRLLEGAGVDVETISIRMADAINEYLHNALLTGASVPEAFRPILQQLATMGLLTDQNGNLITDLEASGIRFADTLDGKFDKLLDTIQEMVEAINRFLGITNDAADAVSSFPTFPGGGSGEPFIPLPPGVDEPFIPNSVSGRNSGEQRITLEVDGQVLADVVARRQDASLRDRRKLRAA